VVSKRTAFASGVVGRLGEALIETLLASPTYSQVYVATRAPLTSTVPKLVPVTLDLETRFPGRIDDVFCCIDQRRGFYGRDRAYQSLSRKDIPEVARAVRNAHARRFVLITPLTPLDQLAAPIQGARDGTELQLIMAGFECLILLRPADTGEPVRANPLERIVHMLGEVLSGYLIPQSMQPLRPVLVARAACWAPDRLGPGTHVLNAPAIRKLLGMGEDRRSLRKRLRG
jgi:hypothetical protein